MIISALIIRWGLNFHALTLYFKNTSLTDPGKMLVVAWPPGIFNLDAKKGNSVSMVPFMLRTVYLASWLNVYGLNLAL